MLPVSKPILGEITAITITTPDLENSLAYYKKLGFSEMLRADWPFPWIQIGDGVLLIMLRKDPEPYLALTYYVKKIAAVAKQLEQRGIAFIQKPKETDMIKRYLLRSPDGLNISLVSVVDGFSQPKGPGMLQMPQQDYFQPEKYVNKTCGLFGELAHPVTDLEQSIQFWEKLGFSVVSKFTSPYPWAIISDGLSIVGLHQSSHFDYPAITFFAADMKEKIGKLKQDGLTNLKEEGERNAVLTTPEQQHIFLFSLGMQAEPVKKKIEDVIKNTVETRRLLLKEVSPEVMRELLTYPDEDVMACLGIMTKEDLETERNRFQLGMTTYRTSFKNFILVEKTSGKVIGKCGFHNWYSLHSRAELGYIMSDESERGKGYMTEAARAIIRYGFEEMGLHRIEAFTSPLNTPSLKIIKGLGFVEEGLLREHYFSNGIYENSACFGLLRREYISSQND